MRNPSKWDRDARREAERLGHVHITDHALVRFLERAGGHEIDAIREALAESLRRAASAARDLGSSDYEVLADGLRYVIKRNCLVTVTPDSPPPHSKALAG
jgi:hypothetical protein